MYVFIIFWSATSFSYKFQTWLIKDCLEPMDEKSCAGEKVNLPAEPTFASVYMRKNWPLCPSQQCLRMLSLSSLDRVVPASWASQSGEMLAGLEWWGHHYRLSGGPTSGSPQPRPLLVVRRLSEPTFSFSCKRFTKFCKEMVEKLARPG